MAREATAAELILAAVAVAQGRGCLFEELSGACPELTWNQIFLEVDRLSRKGQVRLSQDKPGVYRVKLPKPASGTAAGSGGGTGMGHESTEETRNTTMGATVEGLVGLGATAGNPAQQRRS